MKNRYQLNNVPASRFTRSSLNCHQVEFTKVSTAKKNGDLKLRNLPECCSIILELVTLNLKEAPPRGTGRTRGVGQQGTMA